MDIKIMVQGSGDGFGQIWREKTPEEKAIERLKMARVNPEEAEKVVDFFGSVIKANFNF